MTRREGKGRLSRRVEIFGIAWQSEEQFEEVRLRPGERIQKDSHPAKYPNSAMTVGLVLMTTMNVSVGVIAVGAVR